MYGRDRRGGQRRARVVRLDRGVVPLRDGALEDARDGLRGQLEVLDARQVVGDGDPAGRHRQVDGRRAALLVGGGLLGGLHRGVGPGEVDGAGAELLDPGPGADALVVEGRARAGRGVVLDPLSDDVLLERRPGALEVALRAGDARGAARRRRAARLVVVATAGGEGQGPSHHQTGDLAGARDHHEGPPSASGASVGACLVGACLPTPGEAHGRRRWTVDERRPNVVHLPARF